MGDLYPVAIHEIGHALVFSSCQDGFAGFHEAGEVRDDEVRDYYGSYPRTDHYHHFIDGTNDPISKRGAFGNEWDGETPDGRWLVTKLHLLVAQAVGYTLRDTSPFRETVLTGRAPGGRKRWGPIYAYPECCRRDPCLLLDNRKGGAPRRVVSRLLHRHHIRHTPGGPGRSNLPSGSAITRRRIRGSSVP